MPKIVYERDEIKASGRTETPVNAGGLVYIGRLHKGEYVEWVILKKKDSEVSEIEKPDPENKKE